MFKNGEYVAYYGFECEKDVLVRYSNPVPGGFVDGYIENFDHVPITKVGDGAFFGGNLIGVTIPEGVKVIGKSAFKNCKQLKKVVLPEGLEEIGNSAFENCYELESIILPSSIKKVGASAFEGCRKLWKIGLPEGLKEVGEIAFAYSALENVVLPSSVEKIGYGAFFGCSRLETVSCPNIKVLPARLFAFCSSLYSVDIPEGVEVLQPHMFHECDKLTLGGSIVLPESIREMTFAFSTNDVEMFTIYAVPGSYAYHEASNLGAIVKDSTSL